MKIQIKLMVLFLSGFILIGARQEGGCGGMMENGLHGGGDMMSPNHGCCGSTDEDGGYDTPPLGDDYPPPDYGNTTENECSIQVTLIEASAYLTSDLYLEGDTRTLLIEDTSAGVGEIVTARWDGASALSFYIIVHAGDEVYAVYSDSEWATTTELTEDVWIIGFEDMPYPEISDLDYNDVVIVVEAVGCAGISSPPAAESDPILIPEGGVFKVHVNFLEATFDAGDLYLAGDPPELLIEKGSSQKGASAGNFFAGEEALRFILATDEAHLYSDDPDFALIEKITDYNYRINYDANGDGDFEDAIVHVVLTPDN